MFVHMMELISLVKDRNLDIVGLYDLVCQIFKYICVKKPNTDSKLTRFRCSPIICNRRLSRVKNYLLDSALRIDSDRFSYLSYTANCQQFTR